MNFKLWLLHLIADAAKTGCIYRLEQSDEIWHRIYSEGVQPTITAVCQWATEDPDRFIDLRETEQCDHQLAA